MKFDKRRVRVAVLSLLLAGVAGIPYVFSGFQPQAPFREIYQCLLFVPAILAALWYGIPGGLFATVFLGLCLLPLGADEWSGLPFGEKVDDVAEIFLLLIVSIVTGYLSQRLRGEKSRARRAVADLEGAYTELSAKTTQLFAADEQLRRGERLRLLGEMSSELAHEIQNPLASIKGTTEIINDRCRRQCGTGEFLDILISEIKRLRSVLDRFLDFARNQEFEISTCDPLKAFDDVAKLMMHQMEKQRIDLKIEAPEAPLSARISEEQLKQVFLNLVLNSVQAMYEGGAITARFEKMDENLSVTISDTGPGIKDSDRGQIFDSFFSTKRHGTGLGLAIVWRIVKKCSGNIVLAPKTDAPGASFILTLPIASSEA